MPPPPSARHERAVSFPDTERAAWLRLSLTDGLGPAAARVLLAAFGLPQDVFAADREALAQVVGPALARRLLSADADRERAVGQALEWAQAPGNHVVSLIDPGYPQPLLQTADPPVLLYVRGAATALDRPCLAVVGSRAPTAGGARTAAEFALALGDAGLVIVSGLARGIDAAAHEGAMKSASATIAVLGTGIDTVYPPGHRGLADAVVASGGAIVSEMPLGCGPRKANFPRRNRLIAGMSLGVLVVEAALRSGSLITARLAAEAGREVFAIPGSIHSPLAKGCHLLIKQGARLVECAQDVLDELPAQRPIAPAAPAAAPDASAGPAVQPAGGGPAGRPSGVPERGSDPLLALMGWDPVGVDTLVARHAGDSRSVAARLLELELTGRVDRLADGRYQQRA
ncbi:MAG TPA: DNA-processing protein DprA [Quisquiliibacterium sp.]|nr:DNA-processing protein DprA [Quisquiliibacterium sp.]